MPTRAYWLHPETKHVVEVYMGDFTVIDMIMESPAWNDAVDTSFDKFAAWLETSGIPCSDDNWTWKSIYNSETAEQLVEQGWTRVVL